MTPRRNWHLLLPVLALGMTFALAASAQAQDHVVRGSAGTSASLRVSFGAPLHWAAIQGTRVEELPRTERPDYDMFRYGGTYYAYNNNRWYSSAHESGEFTGIDERAVPSEFSSIPREHWHNYPSGWQDRHDQASDGASASLQVNIGPSSRWTAIRGTDVEELPAGDRPNFDVFRSGGTYYAHDNNRWYMSRLESGRYTAMDDRDVPPQFSDVPRDHWNSYPSGWQDRRDHREHGYPGSMLIQFTTAPRWAYIPGSRVQRIRNGERLDYDMFRYAGGYYVYSNDRWYMSRQGRGQFNAIDARAVPSAVYRVPRRHWRNYPSRWDGPNRDGRSGAVGQRR